MLLCRVTLRIILDTILLLIRNNSFIYTTNYHEELSHCCQLVVNHGKILECLQFLVIFKHKQYNRFTQVYMDIKTKTKVKKVSVFLTMHALLFF